MKKAKYVLTFPSQVVEEPVTYHLITRYGVRVNILRARIDPGKQGTIVVELAAEKEQLAAALNYVEGLGIAVQPLGNKIRHLQDRCAACTACVPHCPTGALFVQQEDWSVGFDPEKCVVCFSCLDACIYSAMAVEEALTS